MDVLLATQYLRSDEDATKAPRPARPAAPAVATQMTWSLIGIAIGFFAAYLSWTCNSAQGISVPMKVLYALFAYIFGGLYLILYLIFNQGRCDYVPQSTRSYYSA